MADIVRICVFKNGAFYRFEDCTFEQAAKMAVEARYWRESVQINDGTNCQEFTVFVSDPDVGTERKIVIRATCKLEWINPREGVDY